MAEAGYKLDSTTAHSDTTAFNIGGNAGVSFAPKSNTTTLVLIAAAVVALLLFRGK